MAKIGLVFSRFGYLRNKHPGESTKKFLVRTKRVPIRPIFFPSLTRGDCVLLRRRVPSAYAQSQGRESLGQSLYCLSRHHAGHRPEHYQGGWPGVRTDFSGGGVETVADGDKKSTEADTSGSRPPCCGIRWRKLLDHRLV